MEKKLIALVFVALLGGLGGGYGLGYVVYQPQIQNLENGLNILDDKYNTLNSTLRNTQSSVVSLQTTTNGLNEALETINSTLSTKLDTLNLDVTTVESKLGEVQNKTWHLAYSTEGMIAVSPVFQIKGSWIRIRWYMSGPAFISPGDIDTVEIPWIQILIKFSNGTVFTDRGSSGVYGSYASDIYFIPGEYYLEIENYLVTDYFVAVWDYY